MLNSTKEDIEEIKKIVIYMGIQIRKQKKSLDGLDNSFTTAMLKFDAIEFDHKQLEQRLGITEEDYEKN